MPRSRPPNLTSLLSVNAGQEVLCSLVLPKGPQTAAVTGVEDSKTDPPTLGYQEGNFPTIPLLAPNISYQSTKLPQNMRPCPANSQNAANVRRLAQGKRKSLLICPCDQLKELGAKQRLPL